MALHRVNAEAFARDVQQLSELAVAVCLAPCVDRPPPPEVGEQARELQRVIYEVRDRLDEFLTDPVRADIVQLLQFLDDRREDYRLAFLRWVDLLEEIAFATENRWGGGMGPVKLSEVRAAIYYVLKGFLGPEGVAADAVPPWARPVLIEIFVRITVEFVVTLDNPACDRPPLWGSGRREGTEQPRFFSKSARIRATRTGGSWKERCVGWVVRKLMPPPYLAGPLRERVDAILDEWAKRNRVTGSTPVERFAAPVVQTALWIGRHGNEVRAAVDAVALTVYEAANLAELDRKERIEVVKEAVVLLFADLGYAGPLMTPVVRMFVDLSADATLQIFRKREVV